MAVSVSRVTVSTTAVALNTASTSGQKLTVRNTDAIRSAGADVVLAVLRS